MRLRSIEACTDLLQFVNILNKEGTGSDRLHAIHWHQRLRYTLATVACRLWILYKTASVHTRLYSNFGCVFLIASAII